MVRVIIKLELTLNDALPLLSASRLHKGNEDEGVGRCGKYVIKGTQYEKFERGKNDRHFEKRNVFYI